MNHNGDGSIMSIFLSGVTIIFAFISSVSISEWAGIMAIGAGATAILYNVTKWWLLIHKRKK